MERFTNAAFSFEVTDTAAAGRDGPRGVAILLHGFPQDRRCWDPVTSALAAGGYRVLAPDLRGYSPGARPAARSAYRNSQLAADVLALADAAGAEQFHLAGHDWGAALAWYLAGRHPGRVTSLAALSVPHPQAFAQALITGSQAARSWYMAACQLPWLPERALGRRGGQAFRDTLVRTGLDPASADRYAARARDPAVLRGPLNWYRALPFSLREPAGPIRCVQHRRRTSLFDRAGDRAGHPGDRRWQLRRAVRGRRAVRDHRSRRRPAREACPMSTQGPPTYGNTAGPWEGGRVAVPRARRRRRARRAACWRRPWQR